MKERPMKERPILFSAPMVRAILEGRKTQTRRIVKGVGLDALAPDMFTPSFVADPGNDYCPYGKPGDRLWVRETHAIHSVDAGTVSVGYRERMPAGKTLAQTDGGLDVIHVTPEQWEWAYMHVDCERWRPSIFMPRWASRITLEVIGVRIQRLQEISDEDAQAEGAFFTNYGRNCFHGAGVQAVGDCPAPSRTHPQREGWSMVSTESHTQCLGTARYAFANLWEVINGVGSWNVNPFVWVVNFNRVSD